MKYSIQLTLRLYFCVNFQSQLTWNKKHEHWANIRLFSLSHDGWSRIKSMGGRNKPSESLRSIFMTLFYSLTLQEGDWELIAKFCKCSTHGTLDTEWQFIWTKKCQQFADFWRTFNDCWTQSRLICDKTLPAASVCVPLIYICASAAQRGQTVVKSNNQLTN